MKLYTGTDSCSVRSVVLALLLWSLAGCGSKINMMPTPVIYEGGRINVFDSVPADKRSSKLDVFYATERVGRGPADNRDYTNDVSKQLRLGTATVQFGNDSTTWPQLVEASTAKDRKQEMSLKLTRASEVGVLSPDPATSDAALSPGERAFADQINAALAGAAQPEVSIYAHGYRVTFEEGVAVTAELRHFLGRRQAVVAYAWPSRQGLMDYSGDVDRAIQSAPNLARLIEFIAAHTKAQHINLLGYSAGATLVVEGLVELRDRNPGLDEAALQKKLRVGNVVLAAADVDLKTFVKGQLEKIAPIPRYIEITVSKSDRALTWASRMRGGGSRLGKASVQQLTPQEIEDVAKVTKLYAIDVTKVKGESGTGGHGYWYANPWISSDILTTFVWQLSPEERGLVHVPGKQSWTFPDDYPDRIHALTSDRLQKLRDIHNARDAAAASTAIEAQPKQ